MDRNTVKQQLSYLAMGLIGAGFMVTYQAWANNDGNFATDSVPRVIPYQGVLEFNGVPYHGNMDIRFALFDDAVAGSAGTTDAQCQADANCLWSEEFSGDNAQQVFQGRFSSILGQTNPVTDTIYDAGTLFLGLQVRGPGDATWIALDNRQVITPVPFALWSTQSSNLNVAGNINGASLTVTGDVNTTHLRATGDVFAGNTRTVNVRASQDISANRTITATGDVFSRGTNLTSRVSAAEGRLNNLQTFHTTGFFRASDSGNPITDAGGNPLHADNWLCALRGVQANSACEIARNSSGNWIFGAVGSDNPAGICSFACAKIR